MFNKFFYSYYSSIFHFNLNFEYISHFIIRNFVYMASINFIQSRKCFKSFRYVDTERKEVFSKVFFRSLLHFHHFPIHFMSILFIYNVLYLLNFILTVDLNNIDCICALFIRNNFLTEL